MKIAKYQAKNNFEMFLLKIVNDFNLSIVSILMRYKWINLNQNQLKTFKKKMDK